MNKEFLPMLVGFTLDEAPVSYPKRTLPFWNLNNIFVKILNFKSTFGNSLLCKVTCISINTSFYKPVKTSFRIGVKTGFEIGLFRFEKYGPA